MIVVTADVHHMSMGGVDQSLLRNSEVESAIMMADIAARYDVKVTFFVTGRSAEEEPAALKVLSGMANVEIGGHTYNAFKPKWRYLYSQFVLGLRCGSYGLQLNDVKNTLGILGDIAGGKIVSWRNHGYRNDENTNEILEGCGISHYSDLVDSAVDHPFRKGALQILPINTWPDHDTVDHEYNQYDGIKLKLLRKKVILLLRRIIFPFKKIGAGQHLSIDTWRDKIVSQVENREDINGGVSTLLIHPACMQLIDNFEAFEHICQRIKEKSFETVFVSKVSTASHNVN